VRAITQYCDTVMFCLSKGLAAPIGSILAGSEAFIAKARKKRKLLGGGLRQVGVLAAPGLIALNEMPQRLHEDHRNAQLLAQQLSTIEGIEIDLSAVHINMVWLRFTRELDVEFLMQTLTQAQIKANPPEHGWMRLVTHWQITNADLSRIVSALKTALN
jgi:threonine aldolase